MKQDTAVWFIVAGLAVLAIGSMWYLRTDSETILVENNSPELPASTTPTSSGTKPVVTPKPISKPPPAPIATKFNGSDSINYLLTLKENNYSCSFTTSSPYPYRAGTMYVSGKNVRANFSSVMGGKTSQVSQIGTSESIYTWKNSESTGLKVSAVVTLNGNTIVTHGGIDPTTPVNFKCNPWTPDTTLFAPPSSLTFVDSSGATVQ